MTAVWLLTLVVTATTWGGVPVKPPDSMEIRLPRQEHCEAVRRSLIDLDRLSPESLHVGDCRRVLVDTEVPAHGH